MKLGFIGSGKMASALVAGVIRAGEFPPADVLVTNRSPEKAVALARSTGAQALSSNLELARASDVIFLAVKPAQIGAVLREISEVLSRQLLVSVAAGVTLAQMSEASGSARIIRAMPNTPSLIGRGAAGLAASPSCTPAEVELVSRIFRSVGSVFVVKEELMDAVVGVSGSGPAYLFLVIEALSEAGVALGLPVEVALPLAAQTVAGAGDMVLQTGRSPAELREMVTSPGGTTMAALATLETAGLRAAIHGAVRAAAARSAELGRSA